MSLVGQPLWVCIWSSLIVIINLYSEEEANVISILEKVRTEMNDESLVLINNSCLELHDQEGTRGTRLFFSNFTISLFVSHYCVLSPLWSHFLETNIFVCFKGLLEKSSVFFYSLIKYFLLREIFVKTAFLKIHHHGSCSLLSARKPSYAHYAPSKVSYHSSQFSRDAFWLAESARWYYDLIGRCEIGYFAWLADENESSFEKRWLPKARSKLKTEAIKIEENLVIF